MNLKKLLLCISLVFYFPVLQAQIADEVVKKNSSELIKQVFINEDVNHETLSKPVQLKTLAVEDNVDAQLYLGLYTYLNDIDAARQWLLKAAAKNDMRAQFFLGLISEQERDKKGAEQWYEKAAVQGHSYAQNNLGQLYVKGTKNATEGDDVMQNFEKAYYWFKKSALQGNEKGQNNLGEMYKRGWFVQQDYTEALKWFRMSAAQGYPKAQYNMSYLYSNGFGVEKDVQKAQQFGLLSAKQGYVFAQLEIARMYAEGDQFEKNEKLAVEWFLEASKRIALQTLYEDYEWRYLKTWDFLLLHPQWNRVKNQIIQHEKILIELKLAANSGNIYAQDVLNNKYHCITDKSWDKVCVKSFYDAKEAQ